MTTHADSFVIAIDHPALPGHFPGNPVVPGVVVLDHVLAVAESWRGAALDVAGLPQVKFLSPLLPGERAEVTLDDNGDALRFAVHCGDRAIAQGRFALRRGDLSR
jgi:3-hydroxyacyl-[acyl-carrier-protein] dehydratase